MHERTRRNDPLHQTLATAAGAMLLKLVATLTILVFVATFFA
jgi:hypothetical protein